MTEMETMECRYRDAEKDPIHLMAAEWLTRLQDPEISLEEILEWQRWLAADARHGEAFARIEAIWDAPWELLRARKRRFRREHGLAIAASSLLAVMIGWALMGGLHWPDRSASAQLIETVIGENRSLRLGDGSRITLGGDSRLEVSLSTHARHIELSRGEAFFVVARDPARPFTVTAGNIKVTALGTEFDVHRGHDRVEIAVVEGHVMVTPAASTNPLAWIRTASAPKAPVQLFAGQQATVDGTGVPATAMMPDPGSVTAWQTGQLVFREEPLRDVVADVNRYAPKPIVIADDDVADLKITGTVLSGNLTGWITSLQSAFQLQASEEPDRIVLRREPRSN